MKLFAAVILGLLAVGFFGFGMTKSNPGELLFGIIMSLACVATIFRMYENN